MTAFPIFGCLGSLPSVDQLSSRVRKMPKFALENSSVSIRRLTFEWVFLRIHLKEIYKSIDPTSIPPKLSAGNWFNKMENFDHQLFEIWVSCGIFNKRDLWKKMHRQTKWWKLSWSTDGNDPYLSIWPLTKILFDTLLTTAIFVDIKCSAKAMYWNSESTRWYHFVAKFGLLRIPRWTSLNAEIWQ